ncbi:hypothetical protein MACJ_003637 [Theileria orientalis]|uniref:Uncharacterized protein n=1 Tax=Theileria orientalis TaxID=68886 RepID=A0A976SLH9_THEOR|nr:hypothetical protein MACJ_003637 [Theileria orientalis]
MFLVSPFFNVLRLRWIIYYFYHQYAYQLYQWPSFILVMFIDTISKIKLFFVIYHSFKLRYMD